MSLSNKTFSNWQNELILFKNYGEVTIKFLLNNFVDNLILFIQKNGYNISVSNTIFGDTIASLLYKLDYNRHYVFPISNSVKFDDFYYNFEYIIDWDNFWRSWNYSSYNFFDEAEIYIQHIVWSFIQLDKSDAHIKYLESLEDSDSDNEITKKLKDLDPYLLDQINANNHYKFTRFENS